MKVRCCMPVLSKEAKASISGSKPGQTSTPLYFTHPRPPLWFTSVPPTGYIRGLRPGSGHGMHAS